MAGKQNGILPNHVGKCQHLPTWFGKSRKWKRFQEFLRDFYHPTMVSARFYQSSGLYSNIRTQVFLSQTAPHMMKA